MIISNPPYFIAQGKDCLRDVSMGDSALGWLPASPVFSSASALHRVSGLAYRGTRCVSTVFNLRSIRNHNARACDACGAVPRVHGMCTCTCHMCMSHVACDMCMRMHIRHMWVCYMCTDHVCEGDLGRAEAVGGQLADLAALRRHAADAHLGGRGRALVHETHHRSLRQPAQAVAERAVGERAVGEPD